MKYFKLLLILPVILCNVFFNGCGQKIKQITYKTIDGETECAYPIYKYEIEEVYLCKENGEILEPVNDKLGCQYYWSSVANPDTDNMYYIFFRDYYFNKIDHLEEKRITNRVNEFYLWSSKYNCSVDFSISLGRLVKHYPVKISYSNGNANISEPYIPNYRLEYADYEIQYYTISVPKNNIMIEYI